MPGVSEALFLDELTEVFHIPKEDPITIPCLNSFSETMLPFDPWEDFETVTTVSPIRHSSHARSVPLESMTFLPSAPAIVLLDPLGPSTDPETIQLPADGDQGEGLGLSEDGTPGGPSGGIGDETIATAVNQQSPPVGPAHQHGDRSSSDPEGMLASCGEPLGEPSSVVGGNGSDVQGSTSASSGEDEKKVVCLELDQRDASAEEGAEIPGTLSTVTEHSQGSSSALSGNGYSECVSVQTSNDDSGSNRASLNGDQHDPSPQIGIQHRGIPMLSRRNSDESSLGNVMPDDAEFLSAEDEEGDPVNGESSIGEDVPPARATSGEEANSGESMESMGGTVMPDEAIPSTTNLMETAAMAALESVKTSPAGPIVTSTLSPAVDPVETAKAEPIPEERGTPESSATNASSILAPAETPAIGPSLRRMYILESLATAGVPLRPASRETQPPSVGEPVVSAELPGEGSIMTTQSLGEKKTNGAVVTGAETPNAMLGVESHEAIPNLETSAQNVRVSMATKQTEVAAPSRKYLFYYSGTPFDPTLEFDPQLTLSQKHLLEVQLGGVLPKARREMMKKLYSAICRASSGHQFAMFKSFCKEQSVDFSMISSDIPVGSVWRYFLRGVSVAYNSPEEPSRTIYYMDAWSFLQSLLLAEHQAEFMTAWSQGTAVKEHGEQSCIRVSDEC